jgi:hypothetical protein
MLPREGAEAVADALVGREGTVVGVPRIGGDLLRHGTHLAFDRGSVSGIAEQGVDPALGAIPVGDVVVEQELAEQEAGADVGKRPEGEDPVRRFDEGRERGVVPNYASDDPADRLIDQRDPELVEISHGWIMAGPAYS